MRTILVIEDDSAIRNNIAMILKSQGFAILQAEDGLTGIELALGSAPDLIVCDIMLPEVSGYDILERIRQEPESVTTPFIFLTALADRADMRQGMNLGADDYLTKPFTSQELIGAVNTRLQKKQELTEPYRREMKKAAEHLRQMVYMDVLTNLPNRVLFWQKIEEYLATAENTPAALLLIQILNLEELVDSLGQSVADLMLQSLARSLQGYLKGKDVLSRCRVDGFGFLLTHDADSTETIEAWLELVLANCTQSYSVAGQSVNCEIRVGIAQYPEVGINTPELVGAAEKVLDNFPSPSKKYAFYTAALQSTLTLTEKIRSSLGSALDNNEFELYYQPIVNMITGRMVGLEALLRWSQFKLLGSNEFLDIARKSGHIIAIDIWVLHTALKQLKQWQRDYLIPLKLTINLSGHQLREPDSITIIQQALRQSDVDPSLLTIDVKESDLLDHIDELIPVFEELSHLGIQFALEDFGTGYSSLTYLSRLPFHFLKIDERVIHSFIDNSHSEAIVKAMITMAQSFKLKVIAEGVETEDQVNFLRKQGCPLLQGFVYSPPLSAPDIQSLLDEDRRLS